MLTRLQSKMSGSYLSVWGRMTSSLGDEMVQDSSSAKWHGSVRAWHNFAVFTAGLTLGLFVKSRGNPNSIQA